MKTEVQNIPQELKALPQWVCCQGDWTSWSQKMTEHKYAGACSGRNKTAKGLRFEYVNKEESKENV